METDDDFPSAERSFTFVRLDADTPGISNKMFTQTARELEHSGLIERIIYPVVPPKVEYQLTDLGKSVLPLILDMADWGIMVCQSSNT